MTNSKTEEEILAIVAATSQGWAMRSYEIQKEKDYRGASADGPYQVDLAVVFPGGNAEFRLTGEPAQAIVDVLSKVRDIKGEQRDARIAELERELAKLRAER